MLPRRAGVRQAAPNVHSSDLVQHATDRIDVQVEPPPRTGRGQLADHLLVRPPAAPKVALHHIDQLVASGVVDLERRLVVEVAADAREVVLGLTPISASSSAGPMPERSMIEGSRRRRRTARREAARTMRSVRRRTTTPSTRPSRISRRSTGASPDPTCRSRTGSTYPNALLIRSPPVKVDRERSHAHGLVEVVEVLDCGDAVGDDRVHARTLERGQLTYADEPDAELLPGEVEQRQQVSVDQPGLPAAAHAS